jgi:hypothetical protein
VQVYITTPIIDRITKYLSLEIYLTRASGNKQIAITKYHIHGAEIYPEKLKAMIFPR